MTDREAALWASRLRKAWTMFVLGFASGLPYPLVGTTLAYWMRERALPLTLIGLFSWALLPYSLKFLWAWWLDARQAPGLHALGHRQGWIAAGCLAGAAALLGLAVFSELTSASILAFLACFLGLAGASVDISVDALRIERSMLDPGRAADDLAAYQVGYRAALLISDGAVFVLAAHSSWSSAYTAMALVLLLPLIHLWRRRTESPCRSTRTERTATSRTDTWVSGWMAVRTGGLALLLVLCYRLPDLIATPMINPLLHDLRVGKGALAAAHMSVGLLLSLAGIGVGGWLLTKSLARALWFGWGMQVAALLGFAALAWHAANPWTAAAAWGMECFASSVTGMALVQVMSTRVIPGAIGASYAFLTCIYGLFGRMAGGGSGAAIAVMSQTMSLHQAYALFFAATAAMGVPVAVVLLRYGARGARQ